MLRRASRGTVRSAPGNTPLFWTRRALRTVLVLAALAAISCPVRSQEGTVFDHATVKQGLSQGTVNCILQDSQGFIWLGTQDGLNRFDGYGFSVFKHDAANPNTLNDDFILSIGEDSSRTLWISTLNSPKMLNRYDRSAQTFVQVPRDSVNLDAMRLGAVRPQYVDPAGMRWSGSIGGGLARFDPRSGTTTVFKHDPANASTLADDRVYSVVGDRRGDIWIGTREGLDRFTPSTGIFTHFKHDEKKPSSLSDNWVWPILEDRDGVIWVGTIKGGLNRFDRATESFTHFRHDEANPRSLSGDRLYSLAQDRSGMIWIGTGDHGVDRFHPDMAAFRHFRHDQKNQGSLADDNITSMFVQRSGTRWIGTRSGLDRWDDNAGIFVHYDARTKKSAGSGDLIIQAFAEDPQGGLWLGTFSDGLYHLDPATGSFTHYKNDPANPKSLSDNRIYALALDRGGDLWVGTYGTGLNRFNRKTGEVRRFLHSDSDTGSLAGSGVWSLLEDRDGTLWAGTSGGGLDRFDRKSEKFAHFKHDPKNPSSLSDDIVISLLEDRSGALWAGTTGGLNRLDRTSGASTVFHEKDGLANEMVFGILEDDSGNLWMSTNKGIARFDSRRRAFRTYVYSDGLQGDEFNQGAYAKDPRTGEMFFGGGNGFNVFHPESVKDNPYVPPIVFSAFSRYNTDDAEGKPIVEKGVDAKQRITLSYKDNVANFEFSALSFYNNFRNQYAYKLEGYSDSWIQLGTERRATFTNLDGGEYTLRVRGSNSDGVWNESGASLLLSVLPPWWKTRWAYSGYAILLLCGLYGIRRFEINRQMQKTHLRESELRAKAAEAEKRALEAENERKTKELEDARLLQLSLLPHDVPHPPDYDIAVFMKTATEVGGDYYDFSSGDDGTLNIAFGDATGHGMRAGTIVTLMKGLFLSDAARVDIQPFFNHCSRALKEIKLGRLYMAFSLIRLRERTLWMSSAGMPPVYVYRHSDRTIEEVFLKGLPLGAMKNFPYVTHSLPLAVGDTVLLFSDGLPEQKNAAGDMYDYARVMEAFRESASGSPADIIRHLSGAGDSWMADTAQEDDITLMVIKVKESVNG